MMPTKPSLEGFPPLPPDSDVLLGGSCCHVKCLPEQPLPSQAATGAPATAGHLCFPLGHGRGDTSSNRDVVVIPGGKLKRLPNTVRNAIISEGSKQVIYSHTATAWVPKGCAHLSPISVNGN